jgi:DsbC/DsbD-like thiol-disulfide interchange protein
MVTSVTLSIASVQAWLATLEPRSRQIQWFFPAALTKRSVMIASRLRQRAAAAVLSVALATPVTPLWLRAAHAADASSWDGDARSAMRLVSGQAPSSELHAGIELRLSAGWKTYWRYPGDSGVPPIFDFSKSDNVKSVDVRWPAPHRFTDETGASIGYKGSVLLPLHVVPQNPRRPVVLRLAMDYAICERLCIPAKAAATLDLSRGATTHDADLAATESRVPRPVPLGDQAPFAIRAMRQEGGVKPRVIVDVAAPDGAPLDLFAEGPTPDWALPLPEPTGGAPPGLHRFAFDIDGLPPGGSAAGAHLRFTLVAGDKAIEATGDLK